MFALLAAVIILIIVLNFAGQGAVYYNTKQDNKRAWEECCRNHENWERNKAKEMDAYYSPITKSMNLNYYSDGSLKVDPYTKKTFAKGEYRCDSRGNMTEWRKAGPYEPRPPSE